MTEIFSKSHPVTPYPITTKLQGMCEFTPLLYHVQHSMQ